MVRKRRSREKVIAVILTAVILATGFAPVPTTAKTVSGGNVASSEVPTETGTVVPPTTIDGTTESTVEVGYNAEELIANGKVTQDELTVRLKVGMFTTTKPVSSQKGVVSFNLPADLFKGGNYRASAKMTNGKKHLDKESWGESTATVTERTNVAVTDYTLTENTVYKGGNVGFEVTLNNPGDSSDTIELGVYQKSSNRDGAMFLTPDASGNVLEQVTVGAGNTKTVTLTRSFDNLGTKDVAVNARQSKQLTVENPLEVVDYTLLTDTAAIGEDVQIEATLKNPSSSRVTSKVPLYEGYETGSGMEKYEIYHDTATVEADSTRTVPITAQFDRSGTKYLTAGDGNEFSSVEITNPLKVESYSLSSKTVEIGKSFTVTATVTNPTSNQLTAPVPAFRQTPWSDEEKSKLYLKNRKAATVTLDAGNSKTITFQHSFDNDGEKTITFGDQPYTTVTVNDPLEYNLDGLSKRVVQPGETVTITQTITNPTDHQVPYNLYIHGKKISGTIASGATETKQVTVTFTSEQTGRQHLWIPGADVMREIVVTSDTTVKDASKFEISNVQDFTAVANEEMTLHAKVTNTGEETGAKTVPVSLDGSQIGSDLVYTKSGESEWVFVRTTAPSTPGTYDVAIGGKTATLTVREPVVESVNIEHVGGTTPDKLPTVDASLTSWGSIDVEVRNRTRGLGLTSLGIDKTTELQFTVVVKNYEPRTVVSSGRDLDWKTEAIDGTDKTKVTITLKPSELNFLRGAPQIENWDTLSNAADRATFGIDTAVLLRVDNAKGDSFIEADANNLKGLSISTDAQRFRAPEYHPGTETQVPRLEIPLAAPHLTVDGQVNQGYYEAFLPSALLEEWGVDSKDELTAAYSGGEDTKFTVTETEGGMLISLDLHYSSGTVTISPKERSSSTGGAVTNPSSSQRQTSTTVTATSTTTVDTTATTTDTTETTVEETETTETTETQSETTDSSRTTSKSSTSTSQTTTQSSGGTPGFGLQSVIIAFVTTALLLFLRE